MYGGAGLLPEVYKSRLEAIGFEFTRSLAYARRGEAERTRAAADVRMDGLAYQLCSESQVLQMAERRDHVVWASLADGDAAASVEHQRGHIAHCEGTGAPLQIKAGRTDRDHTHGSGEAAWPGHHHLQAQQHPGSRHEISHEVDADGR